MAEPELLPGDHWQSAAGEHPSEEAWEALACGELAEPRRRALLDHVVGCRECTRIYRALVDLERGAREIDPGAPELGLGSPPPVVPRWVWGVGGSVAAAAAAAVMWISSAGVPPPPAPSPETLRSGTPADAALVLVAPLGEISSVAAFSWEPAPAAASYRFELLDADGELIASAETAETTVGWPATVPATPGRYYWRAVADLELGGTVASPLAAFEITPPSGGHR